jgi:hypothetical protein
MKNETKIFWIVIGLIIASSIYWIVKIVTGSIVYGMLSVLIGAALVYIVGTTWKKNQKNPMK